MKKKVLGLRTVKTALAVTICLAISLYTGFDTEFYSAVVAVVCMQRSSKKTLETGFSRMVGMLVGAVAGFAALMASAYYPSLYRQWGILVLVPVLLMGTVHICEHCGQKESAGLAVVVFLGFACDFGMLPEAILPFVITRMLQTGLGILVAMAVNHFVFPKTSARQIAAAEEEERLRREDEKIKKAEKEESGAKW